MLKAEKKLIETVNQYMIPIAVLFMAAAFVWIRFSARNYVGNEYHFMLYDIPGNRNAFLYRTLVRGLTALLGERNIVCALKCAAYAGDLAAAVLAFLLLCPKGNRNFQSLSLLYLAAVLLLAPVPVLYSAGCMQADSVCMAFVLGGVLCREKGKHCAAAVCFAAAALLYPAYLPAAAVLSARLLREMISRKNAAAAAVLCVLMAVGLFSAVFLERDTAGAAYFFGKLFLVDPSTGLFYRSAADWAAEMIRIYGYTLAQGSLLLAVKKPKWRLPAIGLQIAVIAVVGWRLTDYFAVI